MKICLVACSKTKLDRPAPAQDLYTSTLFKLSRAWAEQNADRWYILSAKHGLLTPETVISPYERSLGDLTNVERQEWNRLVTEHMGRFFCRLSVQLIVLAGYQYTGPIHRHTCNLIEEPLKGMGIGKRLAWLKRELTKEASNVSNPV